MTTAHDLRTKIDQRNATVGIIGLGYVGLPLAHAFHEGGLRVLGFDIDQRKIDDLDAGRNYLPHLGAHMTETLSASDRFESTTDFSRLDEPDAIAVCVPTPVGTHHEPDLSYVSTPPGASGELSDPGNWSRSSPRPTPEQRARSSPAPCWRTRRPPGGRHAREDSSSPSPPSARIPVGRATRRARSPSSWAGSTKTRPISPVRCTSTR